MVEFILGMLTATSIFILLGIAYGTGKSDGKKEAVNSKSVYEMLTGKKPEEK